GDPQAAAAGQRHVGYVIGTDATTGQPVTRTSVALLKEDERYDLTIKLIGRDGKPASGEVRVVLAGDPLPWLVPVEGSTTLRMPRGTYVISTDLAVSGEKPDRSGLAVLVDPETVLGDGPATVVLDASKARLLQTDAPQRTEDRQRKVDFNMHFRDLDTNVRSAYDIAPSYDDVYVSPTESVTQGEFLLTTRWRKGEPRFDLSAFGGLLRFDALTQRGSLLDTGSDRLRSVYAGKGTAADYKKIKARGRLVVVERSDEVSAEERTAAAVAAGAKALVVVNDGVGALEQYVGESTIPVATVHRDAGRVLIALAKLGWIELTAKRTEFTPFVYDLTREYPGQVPNKPLVYQPSQRDLVKIDARYYNSGTPGDAAGYRHDMTLLPSFGRLESEWHPGTRVEWVTPGQLWWETHVQNLSHPTLYWMMTSGHHSYAANTAPRLDWFAPVTRPSSTEAFAIYNSRWQNLMIWNTQAWSSSSDVMRLGGNLTWGAVPIRTQLFQGDTLLRENQFDSDAQWVEVPAGNLPYRAVMDAERPGDVFRLSTRTHSEWTFMSDTVEGDEMLPFSVLNLDYKLETDLHGDVPAGTTQRIGLKPVSMDLGTVPGKITKVTLDVSYDDGATWRKVTLSKGADGYWNGAFETARKPGFISVRASAQTDAGYSVKHEIIRAYGLR
ncbi:PA domain-containing protein, partial [Catellatospora citrea]|uniref:PA domain-containing protein n=1 Tax=Catellatospora citrea TaxID=53366 RepID=UPI0033C8C875